MSRGYFFSLFLFELMGLVLSIREILVSSYDPVVNCSMTDPTNPALIYGIEISIMRDALARINWTEGQDYFFNCTDWDSIFEELSANPIRPGLLGSTAGITITYDRLQSGFKFSLPTISTGISIMYYYQPKAPFYLRSFTTDFLVLLLVLPLLVGVIMYFYESRGSAAINYIYHGFTIFYKVDDIVFLTNPSRIIGLSLKTLLLITVILYVAFTTNLLSADNSFGGVTNVYSLAGLHIFTLQVYESIVESVNGIYESFPDTISYTSDLVNYVYDNDIIYLAYDDPIVSYATYIQCNLYTALKNFEKYDFGFMMPSDVNATEEQMINLGLTLSYANKTQQEWIDEYFSANAMQACPNKPVFGLSYVRVVDVIGLWYAWAVALGICLLIWIYQQVIRLIHRRRGLYSFAGVRAGADEKIQGKMTALMATQCAGSISVIHTEKKACNYTIAQF